MMGVVGAWIVMALQLALLIAFAVECNGRAYGLVGAGRLSVPEAERLTRLVWFTVLNITAATVISQITNTGRHPLCGWYDNPLRPGGIVAWLLVWSALLRVASLTATSAGVEFLTRVWPAVMIRKQLSREWPRREVVRTLLTAILFIAVIAGGLLWAAIARPGTVIRC